MKILVPFLKKETGKGRGTVKVVVWDESFDYAEVLINYPENRVSYLAGNPLFFRKKENRDRVLEKLRRWFFEPAEMINDLHLPKHASVTVFYSEGGSRAEKKLKDVLNFLKRYPEVSFSFFPEEKKLFFHLDRKECYECGSSAVRYEVLTKEKFVLSYCKRCYWENKKSSGAYEVG